MRSDQLAFRSSSCSSRCWPAASRWRSCSRATSCGWRFIWCCRWGRRPGLFFLAGADFVGAMQFLIYVGGTLVLLVFGVMLTAQGPFISMKTASGEWILHGAGRRFAAGRAAADGVQDRGLEQGPGSSGRGQGTTADVATGTRFAAAGATDGHADRAWACWARGSISSTTPPRSRSRRFVGLFAAVRNCVGASAGRADRRGLFGPSQEAAATAERRRRRRLKSTSGI